MKHPRIILIFILLLGAFLRLYNLSSVPPAPSLDEVSIGYNAYSIMKTGRDEYGAFLPLLLRAYDDWRPALYMYTVIPFIFVFGLNVLTVRLPSALMGIATVYAVYKVGNMAGKRYLKFRYLGELAAGLLAISPWHIYISRLGHEANLGAVLFAFGITYLLEHVIERKDTSILWSGICFALSLHGYQSEKITTPMILIAGTIVFFHRIRESVKYSIAAFVMFMLIATPAVIVTFSGQGLSRLKGTSAVSADAPAMIAAQQQYVSEKRNGNVFGMIFSNKYSTAARIMVSNYLSHAEPAWLYTGTDREAHKVPGLGLFYIWELTLLLLGIWALMRGFLPKRIAAIISVWAIVSPIPAAITTQAPHAMRTFTLVAPLVLVEGIGAWWVYTHISYGIWPIFVHIQKKLNRQYALSLFVILCFFGTFQFWKGYFIRFPREQSDSFQYAIGKAVAYAYARQSAYDRIEFAHTGSLYQSYMFFLFYTRYDPAAYLAQGGTASGGYEASHVFGNYAFGYLPARREDLKPDVLYLWDAAHVPAGVREIAGFTNLDGQKAITAGTL